MPASGIIEVAGSETGAQRFGDGFAPGRFVMVDLDDVREQPQMMGDGPGDFGFAARDQKKIPARRGFAAQKCQEWPAVGQACRLEHRMFDHPVAELRPAAEQPGQHRQQHPGPPAQQRQGEFPRGSRPKDRALQLHT